MIELVHENWEKPTIKRLCMKTGRIQNWMQPMIIFLFTITEMNQWLNVYTLNDTYNVPDY